MSVPLKNTSDQVIYYICEASRYLMYYFLASAVTVASKTNILLEAKKHHGDIQCEGSFNFYCLQPEVKSPDLFFFRYSQDGFRI